MTSGGCGVFEQAAHDVEAVAVGEVDVHEHEVRVQRRGQLAGLGCGVGLPDDDEAVGPFYVCCVDVRDVVVVVDDQHADLGRGHCAATTAAGTTGGSRAPVGMTTQNRAPLPSAACVTSIVPCNRVTNWWTRARPTPAPGRRMRAWWCIRRGRSAVAGRWAHLGRCRVTSTVICVVVLDDLHRDPSRRCDAGEGVHGVVDEVPDDRGEHLHPPWRFAEPGLGGDLQLDAPLTGLGRLAQ